MPPTLIDSLIVPETDPATVWTKYRALLDRNDNPGGGDADEMRRCMARLGKTPQDVQADLEALDQDRTITAELADLPRLEEELAAAGKAWREHEEATKALVAERERQEFELRMARNQADLKHESLMNRQRARQQLRNRRPELFGLESKHEEPATPGGITETERIPDGHFRKRQPTRPATFG